MFLLAIVWRVFCIFHFIAELQQSVLYVIKACRWWFTIPRGSYRWHIFDDDLLARSREALSRKMTMRFPIVYDIIKSLAVFRFSLPEDPVAL